MQGHSGVTLNPLSTLSRRRKQVRPEFSHAPDTILAYLEEGDYPECTRAIGRGHIGGSPRLISDEAMNREPPGACGRIRGVERDEAVSTTDALA
jgi:hypothetical protein